MSTTSSSSNTSLPVAAFAATGITPAGVSTSSETEFINNMQKLIEETWKYFDEAARQDDAQCMVDEVLTDLKLMRKLCIARRTQVEQSV